MLYQDPPENERSDGQPAESLPGKMPASRRMICSVCETSFDPADSAHLPFCSARCRQVDLGRWLNESYGLPYESDDRAAADENDFAEED